MATILTVGPQDLAQTTRSLVLASDGFVVTHANPEEALAVYREARFDLVILSHQVTEQTERELLARIHKTTSILRLNDFTRPEELLELIRRALGGGNVTPINERPLGRRQAPS
jgi:DNA-binding NarL/FixJ family response regulator